MDEGMLKVMLGQVRVKESPAVPTGARKRRNAPVIIQRNQQFRIPIFEGK